MCAYGDYARVFNVPTNLDLSCMSTSATLILAKFPNDHVHFFTARHSLALTI